MTSNLTGAGMKADARQTPYQIYHPAHKYKYYPNFRQAL